MRRPVLTALMASGLFFGIVVMRDGGLQLATGYHLEQLFMLQFGSSTGM